MMMKMINCRQQESFSCHRSLTRTTYPEVLQHAEYALTELGESLHLFLMGMQKWGLKYKDNAK